MTSPYSPRQLQNASKGRSYSQGGLNKDQIHHHLQTNGVQVHSSTSRKELNNHLNDHNKNIRSPITFNAPVRSSSPIQQHSPVTFTSPFNVNKKLGLQNPIHFHKMYKSSTPMTPQSPIRFRNPFY